MGSSISSSLIGFDPEPHEFYVLRPRRCLLNATQPVPRAVSRGKPVRLGMAGYDEQAGNSTFFEHGQHATSICGAMGKRTYPAVYASQIS